MVPKPIPDMCPRSTAYTSEWTSSLNVWSAGSCPRLLLFTRASFKYSAPRLLQVEAYMRNVIPIACRPSSASSNGWAAEAQQGSTARSAGLEGRSKQQPPPPATVGGCSPTRFLGGEGKGGAGESVSHLRAGPVRPGDSVVASRGRGGGPGRVQRGAHSPPRNPVEHHAGGSARRDPQAARQAGGGAAGQQRAHSLHGFRAESVG